MRKLVTFIISLAALGLTIGAVSPALGSSKNSNGRHTINMDATITEVNFVDTGEPGSTLGDQIVFSNQLVNGQKQIGHEGAVCTTVSVARHEAQCTATFSFPDGQVTAQGLVVLGSMDPYAVPVTGGSGKYQDVGGELRTTPVSDTQGKLTLRLRKR